MKAYAVPFEKYVNLADARLGTRAISVTDDWFADVNRLFQPTPAVWKEGVFDDNGKWMDGWESRRKRFEGYDHAVIRLGVPGWIKGVDIDTSHFTGNFPPSASLEACFVAEGDPNDDTVWTEVLPAVELQGNSHHYHEIAFDKPVSHLRFNIYPDGGVARLRVHGIPYRDWSSVGDNEQIDLAAALNGGRALACSDEHFGRMSNILNPNRGENMGDGWETARRRTPGNDWVIVALGHPGEIERIVVDTLHFKGNYPDSCTIQAAYVKGGTDSQIETQSLFWRELLPSQKLSMHAEHEFVEQIAKLGPVTHVRLNIFPDGGVSRLRLFGKVAK
ncbi:allantoicase [Stutzerimonas balearica]|jgi:allantoicase|nr:MULTISPECIES: allantoicase [Stutzerimonas stutzeri group]TDL94446.1 allantoicase [Stutzerimonas stutzeri ATCC 17588 = LMG 11199]MBK3870587.1 allantoicase [Stutzerimonas frequens]MBK3908924.1 allantoicase [Stutzerimonas frequens]MBK3929474.1 allantoicase [Stutzerimonas frequens]OMG62902.1 allantoicase [Stutzerimonas balearica]